MLTSEDRDYFADQVREVSGIPPAHLHDAIASVCSSIGASMNEFDNPLEQIHKWACGWLEKEMTNFDKKQMARTKETEAEYRGRMYLCAFLSILSAHYREEA